MTPKEKKKLYNENYRKKLKEKLELKKEEVTLETSANNVLTVPETPKAILETPKVILETPKVILEPEKVLEEPEEEDLVLTMDDLNDLIEKKAQEKADLFFLDNKKTTTSKPSIIMSTLKTVGESLLLMSIPVVLRIGSNYVIKLKTNSQEQQQTQSNFASQPQSTQSQKKSDQITTPFYNTGIYF